MGGDNPEDAALTSLVEETYHSLILASTSHDVKVVTKRSKDRGNPRTAIRWQAEVDALKVVGRHKHITRLISCDKDDLTITLRFEPGRSLDKHVDARMMCLLSRQDALTLLQQMTEALAHIHARHIVHDDLKPENIMWSDGDKAAVLIDFGAVYHQQIVGHDYFTMSGTPAYVPPEFLQRHKGPEADVWALGVTILFALKYIALPDGDWMLPGCFEDTEYYEDGRHFQALNDWHEHIKDVRRNIRTEDAFVINMLDPDMKQRMSRFRLVFPT